MPLRCFDGESDVVHTVRQANSDLAYCWKRYTMLGGGSVTGLAVQPHLAAAGGRQAGGNLQQRRLAAARRTDDREELPGRDFERDVVEGDETGLAAGPLEDLRNAVESQPLLTSSLAPSSGNACAQICSPIEQSFV